MASAISIAGWMLNSRTFTHSLLGGPLFPFSSTTPVVFFLPLPYSWRNLNGVRVLAIHATHHREFAAVSVLPDAARPRRPRPSQACSSTLRSPTVGKDGRRSGRHALSRCCRPRPSCHGGDGDSASRVGASLHRSPVPCQRLLHQPRLLQLDRPSPVGAVCPGNHHGSFRSRPARHHSDPYLFGPTLSLRLPLRSRSSLALVLHTIALRSKSRTGISQPEGMSPFFPAARLLLF